MKTANLKTTLAVAMMLVSAKTFSQEMYVDKPGENVHEQYFCQNESGDFVKAVSSSHLSSGQATVTIQLSGVEKTYQTNYLTIQGKNESKTVYNFGELNDESIGFSVVAKTKSILPKPPCMFRYCPDQDHSAISNVYPSTVNVNALLIVNENEISFTCK